MNKNIIFTSGHLNDPNSGDITQIVKQKENKLYYVIDAVSSCDDPRLAAEYCNDLINTFCIENDINNRLSIGALLYFLHTSLKEHPKYLTVCLAAVIEHENGKRSAFNVGDSRVYEFKKSKIKRITRDDSYIQDLLDTGEINDIEAHNHCQKNFLKQALGNDRELKMNFYDLSENIDGFLITSDGIHGELMDPQIEHILFKEELDFKDAYQVLMERSKVLEGHQDDQSVLLKWF